MYCQLTSALGCVDCYRYVQFSVRLGSGSSVGSCASPDLDNEMVLVQATCNAGIDWHLLRQIVASDQYTQPVYVTPRCLFTFFILSAYTITMAENCAAEAKSTIADCFVHYASTVFSVNFLVEGALSYSLNSANSPCMSTSLHL